MTDALTMMSESEVRRFRGDNQEAGFGALRTEQGALPLEAMRVDAKIDGLVAKVDVYQTFINAIGEPMEATYIFPLPDRAAVTSFEMEVAGRIIRGIIEERGQARERYDRAIKDGHRAAITEEERPGVFTMRVGNIMPGERATVRLTLTGPLPYDEGEATFRFPLVVAPRYVPGIPLDYRKVGSGTAHDTDAVPDASRITPPVMLPGFPNPVRLELRAEIRDGRTPISNLRSALHAVNEKDNYGTHTISVQPGERLDRDFILRWKLAANEVRTSLLLRPDATGDEGTFLLTLIPPSLSAESKPRDVVFVLDRSGSMGGWKMVAARRACARMVDTLRDRDRFTVCAFDDSIESPQDFGTGLVDGTDRNRFRAVEFLAQVDARGGTEMAEPLDRAASQLAGGYRDRERAIVLVTDGQVGNEDQILRILAPKIKNVRIFCVGIDQAVNAAFLKRLADLGGGLAELVESEDRLDEVMDRIHRRIGAPVLTELALRGQDLSIDPQTISPARLPDLHAGAPVVIGGRYKGRSAGSIHLSGSDGAGRSWSETITGDSTNNDAIPSVWARSRVRDLEDRFVLGRDGALEKDIVATSIRFSVLCRFTAFVAVDSAERVNIGGNLREVMQPVQAPSGWALAAKPAPAPAMGAAYAMRTMAGSLERAEAAFDDLEASSHASAYALMSEELDDEMPEPMSLVDRLRAENDPRQGVELLLAELPPMLDILRVSGRSPDHIRKLEALLIEVTAALTNSSSTDDNFRALIKKALRLLDPSRLAFWR
jgi:Ca-activated chloride channel homolog